MGNRTVDAGAKDERLHERNPRGFLINNQIDAGRTFSSGSQGAWRGEARAQRLLSHSNPMRLGGAAPPRLRHRRACLSM
jgi:hypothetical protein